VAGPPAAVAAVRVATRRALTGVPPGALVLVACSGGPDSTALASATVFVAPRVGLRAGLVTVDHGLQDGSAERAAAVVAWARGLGLDPVEAVTVSVGDRDRGGGPEAAARDARYAALDGVALRSGAAAVLLGHTRDDQAETVLLRLARGSGARSLAGMPARRGRYLRPLLDLPRAVTAAACAAENLLTWTDPHNTDPAYARSRVRALLPALDEAVGGGVVAGLARSARLLRADADLLDALAAELRAAVATEDGGLDVAGLASAPAALRGRVLHVWAVERGAPPGTLAESHVDALDALVTSWTGQGPAALPGGLAVSRVGARLVARTAARDGQPLPDPAPSQT
jgi:tRNA(Ile)-lysidine synthase